MLAAMRKVYGEEKILHMNGKPKETNQNQPAEMENGTGRKSGKRKKKGGGGRQRTKKWGT